MEELKTAELEDYFKDACTNLAKEHQKAIDVIDPHTAILYLIPLADRLEIIVTAGPDVRHFKVPLTQQRLTEEVTAFRREIDDLTTSRERYQAIQLYQWIIAPLKPLLDQHQVDTLVFVPDGPLRDIPMAALHDTQHYLVESYAIAVTPGLSLIAPTPIHRQNLQVLVSGLSDPREKGFAPLPYVKAEIDQLEKLYSGTQLFNDTFTVQNLNTQLTHNNFGIVHIASHGQFGGDPARTFVLAYDGRVTLNQLQAMISPSIAKLDQPLELLTLSACETAAGDDRAGLGLAGVAVHAGARSTLATLWSVNDQVSQRLVLSFYRHLKDNPSLTKAKALQEAQKELIHEARHDDPYFWSPYLIVGNWL